MRKPGGDRPAKGPGWGGPAKDNKWQKTAGTPEEREAKRQRMMQILEELAEGSDNDHARRGRAFEQRLDVIGRIALRLPKRSSRGGSVWR